MQFRATLIICDFCSFKVDRVLGNVRENSLKLRKVRALIFVGHGTKARKPFIYLICGVPSCPTPGTDENGTYLQLLQWFRADLPVLQRALFWLFQRFGW